MFYDTFIPSIKPTDRSGEEKAQTKFMGALPSHCSNSARAANRRVPYPVRSALQQLAQHARELGIPLASHDDDRPEKVDVVKALGVTVSEFPINLETAVAARAAGLATLFGAPNVVRGKSQSGSMRALDAVREGVADCLCGDYSPAALLPAVLQLPEMAGIKLHQAVALVTGTKSLP